MALPIVALNDLINNLVGLIPRGWFGTSALKKGGNLYSLLKAAASNDYQNVQNLNTVQQQLYLPQTTGIGVDNFAKDYFGNNLPRKAAESDSAYRARILAVLMNPAGTRVGMSAAIQRALNTTPTILETDDFVTWMAHGDGTNNIVPWASQVVRNNSTTQNNGCQGGHAYRSSDFPYQAWITVQQPATNSPFYLPNANIYAMIAALKSLGTTMWVQILPPQAIWDQAVWDTSQWSPQTTGPSRSWGGGSWGGNPWG